MSNNPVDAYLNALGVLIYAIVLYFYILTILRENT